MEVHIATLGYTKEPVLLGIRAYTIDKIILLFTNNQESINNSEEICTYVQQSKIKCEKLLIDPFDLDDIVLKMLKISEQHPKDNLHINITGGTKIMASSALLAGYILGIKVYYFLDDRLEENQSKEVQELLVELPIPKTNYKEIDETQKRIMINMLDKGGRVERINSEMHDELKLSKQTISYHLKQMKNKELIEIEIQGRNKIAKLTNSGKLFARMLKEK